MYLVDGDLAMRLDSIQVHLELELSNGKDKLRYKTGVRINGVKDMYVEGVSPVDTGSVEYTLNQISSGGLIEEAKQQIILTLLSGRDSGDRLYGNCYSLEDFVNRIGEVSYHIIEKLSKDPAIKLRRWL